MRKLKILKASDQDMLIQESRYAYGEADCKNAFL